MPAFDIFHFDSNRRLIWKESAETFELAQSRIKILNAAVPGDYLIFSQETGDKVFVSEEPGRRD